MDYRTFCAQHKSAVSAGRFTDGTVHPRCRSKASAFRPFVLAPMSETFSTRYAALVAAGKIEADPGQAIVGPATDRA